MVPLYEKNKKCTHSPTTQSNLQIYGTLCKQTVVEKASTNLQTMCSELQVPVDSQVLTRGYFPVLVNSHLYFYCLIYPVLLLLQEHGKQWVNSAVTLYGMQNNLYRTHLFSKASAILCHLQAKNQLTNREHLPLFANIEVITSSYSRRGECEPVITEREATNCVNINFQVNIMVLNRKFCVYLYFTPHL